MLSRAPRILARWAFAEIVNRAMETLYDTRDREAMTVGYHMEGIHFDLLPVEQEAAPSIQAAWSPACPRLWGVLPGSHGS